MEQTQVDKKSGCFKPAIKIILVLMVLGFILETFSKNFNCNSSIDPSSISDSTPEYSILELYDWWHAYGEGFQGVEKMNAALKGKVVILKGEIDFIDKERLFVNFSEEHIAGVNYASGSASFNSQEEMKNLRVGRMHTIAGEFQESKYYESAITTYGGQNQYKFYVSLQGSLVVE